MANLLKELEYLKEVYSLEPQNIIYLNSYPSKKSEWLKSLKELREKIFEDKEISIYHKNMLIDKLEKYIAKFEGINNSSDESKGSISYVIFLSGILGFLLGWAASNLYEKFQDERDKKIAELVLENLKKF